MGKTLLDQKGVSSNKGIETTTTTGRSILRPNTKIKKQTKKKTKKKKKKKNNQKKKKRYHRGTRKKLKRAHRRVAEENMARTTKQKGKRIRWIWRGGGIR